ncbi:MAG: hypothetical protein JNL51_00200 [Chitinophagaceae bacterium]|nr:hypothetical protein [Chitinophagaceae bacterium]
MRSFYNSETGAEISFMFHFNDYFFSDYGSILCNKKSNLNIQAMEDTEILLLHKNDLQKLYDRDTYWQEFGRKMTEKIYLDAKLRIESGHVSLASKPDVIAELIIEAAKSLG